MARVLIVDDEQRIRRILRVVLHDHRHEVDEAATGEEALAKVAELAPEIVALDLNLPDLDGLEVLRRLLERRPATDVIMMTAYGTIRSAVEAMRLGAFDYLTKPFDNDELLLLIDRAIEMRRLSAEVRALREELESRYGFGEMVGISPQMQEVFRIIAKVAQVDATVLVTGESGTGKELVARSIHRRGGRSAGPFVAVNCSAIPETLIESEFFGHEKGAFTDARQARAGRFEQAHGGTLFLDEVAELSPSAQAKLLRALEEGRVVRLGGRTPRPVDVRVIAATNQRLDEAVAAGSFREDLYWRLNVVHVKLPPLREREQDLGLLIDHLLERLRGELGLGAVAVEPMARQLLLEYDWPGNVRELENTLYQALILAEGARIAVSDLPARIRGEPAERGEATPEADASLAELMGRATRKLERRILYARLARFGNNRTATARSLGISRKTLFNKLRQYEDRRHEG